VASGHSARTQGAATNSLRQLVPERRGESGSAQVICDCGSDKRKAPARWQSQGLGTFPMLWGLATQTPWRAGARSSFRRAIALHLTALRTSGEMERRKNIAGERLRINRGRERRIAGERLRNRDRERRRNVRERRTNNGGRAKNISENPKSERQASWHPAGPTCFEYAKRKRHSTLVS
jgi:hypothetical protein